MSERDWRIFREDNDIIIKGGRVPHPMRTWEEGNILPDDIFKAIHDAGYKKPSPIQMQGIPIGLDKRDMIGLAPTGSGKSAAFLIPLIIYLQSLPPMSSMSADLGPYAIIIAPSRELAIQIHEEFGKFAKYTKFRAVCLVGGRSAEDQAMQLGIGVDVIIGTPGRIQDCLERHFTTLQQCHYVVLDEADKMIKENFEESLNYILDCIPDTNLKSEDEKIAELQEKECIQGVKKYRITMMFSATMSPALEKLARKYLRCPSYISIGEPGAGKKEIEQLVEFIEDESRRKERLRNILDRSNGPIMIFVNHKTTADYLCKFLEKYNYKASTLHGGKSQDAREKALKGFKSAKYDILVCTNVAARGIDVTGVTLVVNFDCPDNIHDYVHRIGRTGRANMKGKAITFIGKKDEGIFYDLREYLEKNNQPVPNDLQHHHASRIKPTAKSGDSYKHKKGNKGGDKVLYTN
jgi:ATP-dependent RNA helicase DDX23/PRP28